MLSIIKKRYIMALSTTLLSQTSNVKYKDVDIDDNPNASLDIRIRNFCDKASKLSYANISEDKLKQFETLKTTLIELVETRTHAQKVGLSIVAIIVTIVAVPLIFYVAAEAAKAVAILTLLFIVAVGVCLFSYAAIKSVARMTEGRIYHANNEIKKKWETSHKPEVNS